MNLLPGPVSSRSATAGGVDVVALTVIALEVAKAAADRSISRLIRGDLMLQAFARYTLGLAAVAASVAAVALSLVYYYH